MTEMTMRDAVRALVAPLDSSAIISDNAGDWTPEGLLHAYADDEREETFDLLVEPGQVIREYDEQGYLTSGEALYRVRSPASVSIQEVEDWVEEHIPEALAAVREVVASPEVSPRLCDDGREYWVWESGEIPVSIWAALRGVSHVLDMWAHEVPTSLSPEEVAEHEAAMRAIDAAIRIPGFVGSPAYGPLRVIRIRDVSLAKKGDITVALLDVQAQDGLTLKGRLVCIYPDGCTQSARWPHDSLPSDRDLETDNSDGWLPVEDPIDEM